MQRLQKSIMAAVIASEVSHVFCCVLPVLFSVLSLLAGLGMVSAMPQIFVDLHQMIHAYEVPMITLSAVVLGFGWLLYYVSRKLDCHDTGCGHGPCEPRKQNAHVILKIATVLFVINLSIYVGLHRTMDITQPSAAVHQEHDHRN